MAKNKKIRNLLEKIERNPNEVTGHFELACALLEDGQQSETINEFKKALELDREMEYHSIINYHLGLFYYSEGEYGKAINEFEKSVENLPRFKADENSKPLFSAKLHYSLGRFLILRSFHDHYNFTEKFRELRRAKECFEKSLRIYSADMRSREMLFEVEDIIEQEWNRADSELNILKWYNGESD